MKISFDIPDNTFWGLATIAEKYDMKVHEYLLELASAVRPGFQSDPVTALWRAGYTDKQIAARLVMTNTAVATRRRKHNLPANKSMKPA